MNFLDDITLLLCVDNKHLDELKFSYKTWEKFKPELTNLPKFIIYDVDIEHRLHELNFITDATFYPFKNKDKYPDQRSAMLTSFFEGIFWIPTKYYIKIDTDCVAVNNDKSWIYNLADRDDYMFITNPWGYTKGFERIKKLENWGDITPIIKEYPRLNLSPQENSDIVKHKRIISWFFLGNTEWTNEMSKLCWKNGYYELPIPSQDTFIWYCADRIGVKYKKVRFKKCGFDHGKIKKFANVLNDLDEKIKLVIGAGRTQYDGWINTNKRNFDVTKETDWEKMFKPNSVDIILAEHVWEHLTESERTLAAKNIKKYLKTGGYIRIAVPDGFHPNKEYIKNVDINGTGKSANDHKYLYTYKSLKTFFETHEFNVKLLEYFDENGNFIFNKWNSNDGHIKRSSRYDRRNKHKKLSYTSLIVDCYKG